MKTFHDCINAAKLYLYENKIDCPEFDSHLFTGGVSYDETATFNFEIESIKGKKTKAFFHFVVSRKCNGLYETITYIL